MELLTPLFVAEFGAGVVTNDVLDACASAWYVQIGEEEERACKTREEALALLCGVSSPWRMSYWMCGGKQPYAKSPD